MASVESGTSFSDGALYPMDPIFRLFLVISIVIVGGCAAIPQNSTQTNNQTLLNASADDKYCLASAETIEGFPKPDYDDLWNRIRAGYGLTYQQHRRIQTHLNWYRKHPEYIQRVSTRAEKYLYYIVEQAEIRNMPTELALLPVVESAFDPFAYSHGSASGMWQFIASTGKYYGLKQNWWYDGRRDVVAATNAALDYLNYLNRRFDGDWLLALAAYNAGEGNVRKAIRRNNRLGKPTDFWSLRLPKETRAYVPQLLALSKVVMEPAKYQATLHPIANSPYFESVSTGSQIDIAQAANLAGLSIKQMYQLNPGFNRWATAPEGPHHLLVPVDKAADFRRKLENFPSEDRVGWKRYTIKNGDSLIAIAKKFNTEVGIIKDTNKIRGNNIRAGKTLMIPIASRSQTDYLLSSNERLKQQQSRSKGKTGDRKIEYRVKAGDSLWSIAKKYKVSVRSLAKWNAMAPKDTLRQNQKLVIWSSTQQMASGSPADSGVIRKVSYKVRNGDSLARIAGKFNVSVNDIARWNPVNRNSYIHPGQSLTLYVDVTRIN